MQPRTTTNNHPQPPAITHNHPQSSITMHNYPRNQPQPATTIHNHPKITHKSQDLSQTAMLLTLHVNTEAHADF